MKKIVIIFLAVFSFINVRAIEFDIKSNQAILYNMTEDNVLYEKNPDQEVKIASLTKLMTVYTALTYIEDLDTKVIMIPSIFKGLVEENASVAGFKTNEEVTYRDLLYGAMLPSGADATNALGHYVFGSMDTFIEKMNELAKEIGMNNSVFTNTTGLDMDGQKSTVNDLLTLLKVALKNDAFKELFTTTRYTTSSGRLTLSSTWKRSIDKNNIDVNIIGGKTGFTHGAGLCLASMSEEEGQIFLLITTNVMVKSSADPLHIKDARTVYNKLFREFNMHTVISENEVIKSLPIRYGETETYNVVIPDEVNLYMSDNSEVTYNYVGIAELSSKNKLGDKIGSYEIYVDGDLRKTVDIILDQDIKLSFTSFMSANWHIVFGTFFMVVSIMVIVKLRKRRLN